MTKEVTYNFKYDKKCYVLVGNIGCGKSTYVKNNLQGENVIVSRDCIRYMFGNGKYVFDKNLEPVVHATNIFIIKGLMMEGVNIAIDETNVNDILRGKYISLAKEYGYKIIAIVLPRLPRDLAVERRMNDPHGQPYPEIWRSVWERFDEMYIEPTLEEGFDEIVLINN